jgi:hypothetical protein
MKDIAELIGTILFIVLLFAMAFVFEGNPNLWDKWHAQAMGHSCPAQKE